MFVCCCCFQPVSQEVKLHQSELCDHLKQRKAVRSTKMFVFFIWFPSFIRFILEGLVYEGDRVTDGLACHLQWCRSCTGLLWSWQSWAWRQHWYTVPSRSVLTCCHKLWVVSERREAQISGWKWAPEGRPGSALRTSVPACIQYLYQHFIYASVHRDFQRNLQKLEKMKHSL